MDIELKVKSTSFENIKKGTLNYIQHGYSKNKKYTRLFGNIQNLIFRDELTSEKITRIFKSISIFEENQKKYFKIEFI